MKERRDPIKPTSTVPSPTLQSHSFLPCQPSLNLSLLSLLRFWVRLIYYWLVNMDIEELLGRNRPAAIKARSAIYVWGYNQSGQTSRKGRERQLRIPKQLSPKLFGCPAGANSRWLDIACGREHIAAVASDGSLFTWGKTAST